MTAAAPGMELLLLGLSHRTAPAELRERVRLEAGEQPAFLAALRRLGLRQALVLSTCERTELYLLHEDPVAFAGAATAALAARAGCGEAAFAPALYRLTGEAARRHLFAVAASLDSAVIGEPHILGQLKGSHRLSADAALVGPALEGLLQAAYAAAKRVRTETAIGQRAVSLAAAAVETARRVHGALERCRALLIGPGEIGEPVAAQFRQAGIGGLTVAHRSAPLARPAAEGLAAHVADLPAALAGLASYDIVAAALGGSRPVLAAATVAAALKARRRRPMLLLDLALPGDIDPAVNGLEDAFLFGLDDLEAVAMEGRAAREAAAAAAWRILEEELARLADRSAARQAALRSRLEAVRAEVLAARPSTEAAAATRHLVDRLLQDPASLLRAAREAAAEAPAETPSSPQDEAPDAGVPALRSRAEGRGGGG